MLKARCPELNELPDTDPDNPLNFENWSTENIEEPDKIKALKAILGQSLMSDRIPSQTERVIGQRCAHLRRVIDLAQKLGVTQSVVSDYERGTLRLHGELIIQLARILNTTTDELLGFSADPKKRTARPATA